MSKPPRGLIGPIYAAALPAAALLALNLLNGASQDMASAVWIGLFVCAVLASAWAIPALRGRHPNLLAALGAALLIAIGAATLAPQAVITMGAPLFLVGWFVFFVRITGLLLEGKPALWKLSGYFLASLAVGGGATALAQIEIRFSDEEFFAGVQALELAAVWAAFAIVDRLVTRPMHSANPPPVGLRRRLLIGALGLAGLGLAVWTLRAYQNSFYGLHPPAFTGITDQSPFVCGQSEPANDSYSADQVQQALIDLVAANPVKTPPELGLLALTRPAQGWEQRFRASLLDEARRGDFTGPAFSVKYGQCLAARRAYYYGRVRGAYPELFSTAETEMLADWFAAVNRRALTVEPVDWFYALAFRSRPQGPYENQECGAALLAVLEAEGLSDPTLAARNRSYLASKPLDELLRFRNSDDSYVYQEEWLINRYFQSLIGAGGEVETLQHSYDWFLLQSLPDGSPLRYNHIGSAAAAQTAFMAAARLQQPQYLWLAGRSAATLEGKSLAARPGMELELDGQAEAPAWGSCLLFGQTGLPTRIGPLAPDKVIFRSGWQTEDVYLLLNLRFTGWHRYKATNTAVLLYQAGPLAGEDNAGESFHWLPKGRSLFRDKRIPRQNLNGLVIPRAGLDRSLYQLLGAGGPWAQDPPFYAKVDEFSTGAERDVSVTRIADWHGWQHIRSVYFYHDGPLVVVDEARGREDARPGLVWKLYQSPRALKSEPNIVRYLIRDDENPAEMALVSLDPLEGRLVVAVDPAGENGKSGLLIQPSENGEMRLATVFLTGDWAGASLEWDSGRGRLLIQAGERTIEVHLP